MGDHNLGAPKSHATDLGPDGALTRWGPNRGAQILGPKSRATDLGPGEALTDRNDIEDLTMETLFRENAFFETVC